VSTKSVSARALLRAALGLLLLGAAAAAQDADALARFRKAFDGPGTTNDRVAAAEGMAAVKGRSGPEMVCRALGASLERSEALAVERSRYREELAALNAKLEANGNRGTPEEIARQGRLRELDEVFRDRGEEEGRVEKALRTVLPRFTDPKALEWLAGNGIRGSSAGAVRAAAAEALGLSGSADPGVIRSVRGALKDKDPQVREAALKALTLLAAKEEETLRNLATALEEARWTVRVSAARRLADMAVPGAVDLLVARIAKEQGHEARVMGALLEALTGQKFGTEADGWRHWWAENRAAFASGKLVLAPGAGSANPGGGNAGESNYYGIPIVSRRVLFVIDVSGSMLRPGGKDANVTKVDEAKKELLRCLKTFEANSSFGVFSFSDGVRKWKPGIVRAEAAAKEDARKWVEALEANHWTNTYAALEEALRVSAADPRNNMGEDYGLFADTIFLLTDGSPTNSVGQAVDAKGNPEWPKVLEAVRGWNREKRVAIHCIGVGPDINAGFLSALAEENGGTFVTVR
jgi:uncharacterized protein YegL